MPFKCKICDKNLKTKIVLRNHIQQVHEKKIVGKCDICLKEFTTKGGLVYHKKHVHQISIKNFTCDICDKSFVTQSVLKNHVKCVHEKKMKNDESIFGNHALIENVKNVHEKLNKKGKYHCDICPKYFGRNRYLKLHKLIEHGYVRFACELCEKHFSYKETLLQHVKKAHEKVKDISNILSENQMTEKQSLKQQIQSVHENIKYTCSICKKQFPLKQNYIRHIMNVHDRKKCSDKNHLLSKTNLKQQQIQQFLSKANLEHEKGAHERIQMTHDCKLCGKQLAAKLSLKTHTKRFHEPTVVLQRMNPQNKCYFP